jgi:hypothetical protein
MNPRYLLNYRNTKYSLDGEAGVLEYVLSKLPNPNQWVVEFGACDGLAFSNSAHLITNLGYSAVLIEPDNVQFNLLLENMRPYSKVNCLKTYVGIEGDLRLDIILGKTECHKNPDLMVIDIDNNDYHIFKTISEYSPKILMIEINSTLLPEQEKIAEYDTPFVFGKHGSSILSMTRLAEAKGYRLISNISCNAIYIQEMYYSLFFSQAYSPADFYTYEGIYGKKFWQELSLRQKWRKLSEALRREWVVNKSKSISHIIHHFSHYCTSTAARFLRIQ